MSATRVPYDSRSRAQRLQDDLAADLRVALGNEMVTRKRVDKLEQRADALEDWRGRDFRGRLRWLLRGR